VLLRILIVDDSLSVLKTLKRMIERQGHQVSIAMNGLEAVRMVKQSWQEVATAEKDVVFLLLPLFPIAMIPIMLIQTRMIEYLI